MSAELIDAYVRPRSPHRLAQLERDCDRDGDGDADLSYPLLRLIWISVRFWIIGTLDTLGTRRIASLIGRSISFRGELRAYGSLWCHLPLAPRGRERMRQKQRQRQEI